MVGSSVVQTVERWPLQVFVLMTVAISWPAWGVLAVYDLQPGLNLAGILWLLGGLGPPIAAIVVVGLSEGIRAVQQLLGRLVTWRVEGRWYAVAVLLPGAVVAAALIIDALLYDVLTPLPSFGLLPLFIGSIAANMLLGGGLEEIGWRGFALPRLQAEYSALTASLLLGIVWIAWHAPLFVVPGAIQAELRPLPFLIQGLALAVVFTWLYNSTRGSLLLVVLLHGTVNAWLTSVWFLRGGVSSTTLWVFAGLLAVIAICLVVVYGREHLSRHHRQVSVTSGSETPEHRDG
jgi:membrane protease YdiL (CAAX protease family)